MANANANDEVQKHVATITLSKLVPSEYRMWVVQAEATLGVYDCLEIVRGNEQNPLPQSMPTAISQRSMQHYASGSMTGIVAMHEQEKHS